MKKTDNVLLIGLGAIGMLYAASLRKLPGIHFRILVDEERLRRYCEKGVFLNGERLSFDWITPEDASGEKADLILIATKSHGFAAAMEMIAPFVGEDTLILPLLNGISAPELLQKRFPRIQSLYGLPCFLRASSRCVPVCWYTVKYGRMTAQATSTGAVAAMRAS